MYPLNWPFSGIIAILGVPLSIKIDVFYDDDAKVYCATSPTVRGLNLEHETLDGLKKEVEIAIPNLLMLNEGIKLVDVKNKNTKLNFCTPLYA